VISALAARAESEARSSELVQDMHSSCLLLMRLIDSPRLSYSCAFSLLRFYSLLLT